MRPELITRLGIVHTNGYYYLHPPTAIQTS